MASRTTLIFGAIFMVHYAARAADEYLVCRPVGSGVAGYRDGEDPGAVQFDRPWGVTVHGDGTVYVTDANRVRTISVDGVVRTVPVAAGAEFSRPYGVSYSRRSNVVIVADYGNNLIRAVQSDGTVMSFPKAVNGPSGIVEDSSGNVVAALMTEYWNNMIVKVTPAQAYNQTVLFERSRPLCDVGCYAVATPRQLAIGAAGAVVYSADYNNNQLLMIQPDGSHTVLAEIHNPVGIALNAVTGDVFTTSKAAVYRVTSAGTVTLVAGRPDEAGSQDGEGLSARFSAPAGVAVTSDGARIIVVDYANNKVRQLVHRTRFASSMRLSVGYVARGAPVGSIVGVLSGAKWGNAAYKLIAAVPQPNAFRITNGNELRSSVAIANDTMTVNVTIEQPDGCAQVTFSLLVVASTPLNGTANGVEAIAETKDDLSFDVIVVAVVVAVLVLLIPLVGAIIVGGRKRAKVPVDLAASHHPDTMSPPAAMEDPTCIRVEEFA